MKFLPTNPEQAYLLPPRVLGGLARLQRSSRRSFFNQGHGPRRATTQRR